MDSIQTDILQAPHADKIVDMAYDEDGQRLATASLDHRLWVVALDDEQHTSPDPLVQTKSQAPSIETGTSHWATQDCWKAHDASLTRVAWAPPVFGSILASASTDTTVKVWLENKAEPSSSSIGPVYTSHNANGLSGRIGRGNKWKAACTLNEAKATVKDIAFAPVEFGLRLHTLSTDGVLRAYDWADPLQLNQYAMQAEMDLKLQFSKKEGSPIYSCLSCIKEHWWGPCLVASIGGPEAVVLRLGPNSYSPDILAMLSCERKASICTVSWAPACGRSFQSIAIGRRDGSIQIYKLLPPSLNLHPQTELFEKEPRLMSGPWTVSLDLDVVPSSEDMEETSITRVDWNTIGTMLSVSSSDGLVHVYKSTFQGRWENLSQLSLQKRED